MRPKSYGLSLGHKHLPEMQKISGLAHTPMFVPVVCDYYCGMQVLVPLDLTLAGTTAEAVAAALADYYKDAATVKVHGPERAAAGKRPVLQRHGGYRPHGTVPDRERRRRPDDAGLAV